MATFSYTSSGFPFVAFTTIRSADVNQSFNDVATFFNTAQIGTTNISAGGVAASNLASGAALSNIGAGGLTSTYLGSGAAAANIGAGALTGSQLANLTVTASQIANATITAAKMVAATLTGNEIASNVNLAGTAVQANSRNLLVSAVNSTTNLSVVWAYIPAAAGGGSAPSYGQGVSTITQPTTGQYTIQFTTAFASSQVIFAIPVSNNNTDFKAASALPITATTEGRILISDTAGAAVASDFMFFAIGPR